jgi:diphthine-ammonia ligase
LDPLERLDQQGLDFLSIGHINLYLATMDLFPYNTYFGPSPPTRACVASILPSGCYVKMDVVAYREQHDGERSALHVRGFSYWAPANIGPYSQAVRTGERLFVAGQIGLIPPTLSLPDPPSFAMEAALSSQHVRRIVQAVQEGTGGGFTGWMESCVCWISGPPDTFNVKRDTVRKAWNVWRPEPDRLRLVSEVPMLIVQVPGLPKGAQVEWQITWTTSQAPRSAEEDEDIQDTKRHFSTIAAFKEKGQQFFHTQKQVNGLSSVCITTIAGEPNFESASSPVDVLVPSDSKQEKAYAVRAFHTLAEEEQSGQLLPLELYITGVALTSVTSFAGYSVQNC